jgi:hypothetical protein
MMLGGHIVYFQTVELVHEEAECSSRLFSIAMQEPGVGFANNQI